MQENKNSRKIEIQRHFNLVEMSQEDPEVKAWLGQSYKPIGPYFKDKVIATGLNKDEIKLILPSSAGVGMDPEDKDFRRAVENFYHNLLTRVDKDGLILEIGLQEGGEEISEQNLPINIKDYIIYRHALTHPHVARSKDEAARDQTKRFYIVDPNQTAKAAMKSNEVEDQAMAIYYKYREDMIKIDQILTLMGRNIDKMDKNDKILELKKLAQRNRELSERAQIEQLNRFISIAEDKNLELKFLIEEAIAIKYLSRVGNNIVYAENGNLVGENLEDAVLYFNNPKKTRELNLLKVNYSEKSKRGKTYFKNKDKDVDDEQTKAE